MNKIFSMLAVVAATSIITGCTDYDNGLPPEYASVVRIDKSGEQEIAVWSTDAEKSYDVRIMRGGHDVASPTTAVLRGMTDDEWTAYSRTYNTSGYYRLPADCYSMDEGGQTANLRFAANQLCDTVAMTLSSENIGKFDKTLPSSESGNANVMCLPFILESTESSVFADQKYLVLCVEYKQPTIELSPVGFKKYTCTSSAAATQIEYTLTIPGENPWGLSVKVKNDQATLDSYNQTNETHYQLMTDALEIQQGGEWVAWTDQTFELPVGTTTASFKVRIVPSKLGMMDAFALTVAEPTIALNLNPAKTISVAAGVVKPSGIRIKNVVATCSDEDSAHPAANLVDGKSNTYFATLDTERDGDPVYGSYVDFKMPSPMQYFSVDFTGRSTGFEVANVPDQVDIYVSTDGANWTLCDRIRNMQSQVTKGGAGVNFGNFDAGQPLQYIRWAVVKGGAGGVTDFRAPKTRIYWDARNLNIYAK